jgi:hypothetical protein
MRWSPLVLLTFYLLFSLLNAEKVLKSASAGWHCRIWHRLKNFFSGNERGLIHPSDIWDWRQAGVSKERAIKRRTAKTDKSVHELLISTTSRAQEISFASRFSPDEEKKWAQSELHGADTDQDFLDQLFARTESHEATRSSEATEIFVEIDSHVNVDEINPHLPIVAVVVPDGHLVEILETVLFLTRSFLCSRAIAIKCRELGRSSKAGRLSLSKSVFTSLEPSLLFRPANELFFSRAAPLSPSSEFPPLPSPHSFLPLGSIAAVPLGLARRNE